MKEDFLTLAEIGGTGNGGVNRPALSTAHLQARDWFKKRILEAGLEFHMDSAGNYSGLLSSSDLDAPTLLLGSHLDSVTSGGRFDGALGVIAALETLRTIKENHLKLPYHLEAIDFTDEEGTLVGLLGSSAVGGKLHLSDLQNPIVGKEAWLLSLDRAGLREAAILNARRNPRSLAGYLELHIEQGPRLEKEGAQIGVVTSIVGIGAYRLVFMGRADHAGTVPLVNRLDAGLGASAFNLAAREITISRFPQCVINVGRIELKPGARNIVPDRATLTLEFRSPEQEQFSQLEKTLFEVAQREAGKFGLGLEMTSLGKHQPVSLSPLFRQVITNSAHELGLKVIQVASGAGHDGQMLADVCPVGMIFVPSVDGASHSPREYTEWQDCVNGANVLLQATLKIMGLIKTIRTYAVR